MRTHAMPKGGTLTVTVEEAGWAPIPGAAHSEGVLARVADTGTGIPRRGASAYL